MRTTAQILEGRKDAMRQRFHQIRGISPVIPPDTIIPDDPAEALRLGLRLGHQEGYGTGLVDGTALGLDVTLEAVDEVLRQPVIFGCPAEA